MFNNKLPEFASDFIWINGEFLHLNKAYVPVLTHSLHYAGAAWEGERAYNGKIFKLEEHTNRLLKSAEYMGLVPIKYSAQEINAVTYELLEKNSLKDAYIRPLIWRGAESMAIYNPTLTVNMLIIMLPSRAEFLSNLKLNLSSWCKPSPKAFPPQAKSSTHYGMPVVSQITASNNGYDDSLVLDEEGYVAECNVANIFFGKGNKLVTPIADRFLNGITRQAVIEMAKSLEFEVIETRIPLEDLDKYEYSFITGTAREIGGVSSIDLGKIVHYFPDPDGKIKMLQSEFARLVGK
ncbi:MAG: aminotransferase class IV [Rickettsiaceae bacterium]|nr:aminotransferase class IV [Rickettsiaceae bacterium]